MGNWGGCSERQECHTKANALPVLLLCDYMPALTLPRQLCLLLHAENIFHSMADILLKEEDLKFASTMVQTLNTILLTSAELFQLRNQLKDLHTQVGCASVGVGG